jgi:polyvinyl alcohol dehydrogenase (cytochrome)
VYFGFGGNYGDCATYRGRLASVPESGGTPHFFTVDSGPGESQGAIWMGGAAPAVGPGGDLWVATGNGSVYSGKHAYDDSDGILEISPSLRLLHYFAPASWAVNNSHDLDMSTEPVVLPDGQVIAAGKSQILYLFNGTHLGGIGM